MMLTTTKAPKNAPKKGKGYEAYDPDGSVDHLAAKFGTKDL